MLGGCTVCFITMPLTRSSRLARRTGSSSRRTAPEDGPSNTGDDASGRSPAHASPSEPAAQRGDWGEEREDRLQDRGDEDADGDYDDMPLPRTSSVYHRWDDTKWSCGVTLLFILPLVGCWWCLSASWRQDLMPQLQQMLEGAKAFWNNHRIVTDEDLAAFKSSRNAWHQSILVMRNSNREEFDTMLVSGRVTAPGTMTMFAVVNLVAIFLLLFLPDASIFLAFETRQRPWVRIMFNAVVYVRFCLCVLAVWQLVVLYQALHVSMDLATALEANVKDLHRLADELLLNVTLDPDEYELKAYRHERRRWGIKATIAEMEFSIDHQFWIELRNKSAMVGIVLYLVFLRVWRRIQDERKWQMKRERSIAEKFLPALPDFDLLKANTEQIQLLQQNEAELRQELVRTQSKVSQISTSIPLETLTFDAEIGRGGYGIVWKGKWRDLDVAMKAVVMPSHPSELQRVMLEKDIFLSLSHPSLVQCYGTSEQAALAAQGRPARLWIVMELCEYGTLDDVLYLSHPNVQPARRLQWMRQIASGMGFLHERGICHRDLKAANVLIDKHKHVRMCDYGVSKLMGRQDESSKWSVEHNRPSTSGKIGTWHYMPPEALRGECRDHKALDVFSFGVLLNEIASGKRPWAEVPEGPGKMFAIQKLVATHEKRPQLAHNITLEFRRLIEECWDTHPARRLIFDGPRGIVSRLGAIKDYVLENPRETPGQNQSAHA